MKLTLKKTRDGYYKQNEDGSWEPIDVTITSDREIRWKAEVAANGGHRIPLPTYSLANELWNSISHGLGGIFGLYVLIFLVFLVAASDTLPKSEFGYYLASAIIYGVSLTVLFTISCIYHALAPNRGKRVMRVIDHDMVFLLVAGTYTPICLTVLRDAKLWGVIPYAGWIIFGIVWICTIIGIVFNSVNLERHKILCMILYICAGWVIVLACYDLGVSSFGWGNFAWLLSGGILYTAGSILYGLGKSKPWMHSVFHFFVLFAAIFQFIGIYFGIFAL